MRLGRVRMPFRTKRTMVTIQRGAVWRAPARPISVATAAICTVSQRAGNLATQRRTRSAKSEIWGSSCRTATTVRPASRLSRLRRARLVLLTYARSIVPLARPCSITAPLAGTMTSNRQVQHARKPLSKGLALVKHGVGSLSGLRASSPVRINPERSLFIFV